MTIYTFAWFDGNRFGTTLAGHLYNGTEGVDWDNGGAAIGNTLRWGNTRFPIKKGDPVIFIAETRRFFNDLKYLIK